MGGCLTGECPIVGHYGRMSYLTRARSYRRTCLIGGMSYGRTCLRGGHVLEEDMS